MTTSPLLTTNMSMRFYDHIFIQKIVPSFTRVPRTKRVKR